MADSPDKSKVATPSDSRSDADFVRLTNRIGCAGFVILGLIALPALGIFLLFAIGPIIAGACCP